jgi:RNA-dependent RNA polymerase
MDNFTQISTIPSKQQPWKPPNGPLHYPNESEWRKSTPRSERDTTLSLNSNIESERNSPAPLQYEWREWPNVKVKVRGIFEGLGAQELHDMFSQYGFVSKIDCDERNATAFVTFLPPPLEPFWFRGFINLRFGKRKASLRIDLVPNARSVVQSPMDPRIEHRAFTNIYAHELAFGVMIDDCTMMKMRELTTKDNNDIVIQLNLRKQELDIRFKYPVLVKEDDPPNGRFRVTFRDLKDVQSIELGDDKVAFVFTLQTPPEYFKQLEGADVSFESSSQWNEWSSWSRQTEFVEPAFETKLKESPLHLRTEHTVVDFGRWLTYYFVVDRSRHYEELLGALRDFNIRTHDLRESNFELHPRKDATIWTYLELSSSQSTFMSNTSHSPFSFLSGMAEMESGISHLPFPVLWQLMVCISRGYLNEYNMSQDFLQRLNDVGEHSAQNILERIADRKLRFHDPMKIFTYTVPPSKHKRIPPYCSLLYACTITPTTIYFSSPVVEISNRVIRKNSNYQDRFLRVRFTEENSGRIHSQGDSANDNVFSRIRRFLKYGLVLGDRHYEFLAFGNSQFREHGLYAFASIKGLAEIPDKTAEDIRSQLGSFSHIRVPAKWCARLGQSFSTTRTFGTSVNVTKIPDLMRGKYNFSDGVGKMSSFVASMVGLDFGRSSDDPPSVIQFRLGGCKGILAIAPEAQGCDIHIRDSQHKFESKNLGLEIIRTSQFVSATLNRQIIAVLSTLGVKDQIFTDMLRHMLFDLETAMSDDTTACRLLAKNVDFNHMTLTMVSMILDGFMKCQDPFMISMLRLWRSWTIKYLKEKAKIFVDKGACVFGCVDEYGVLKGHFEKDQSLPKDASLETRLAGLPEVFVQMDTERDGKYRVLEGVCFIARNPSLHAGDIRIVRAVDKPQLRHLKDVLVMPQTGDRDLGSMCSGGDLDGDDYLVVWDHTMFPPMEKWNYPPMDFSPHPPKPLHRDVTVDDISEFFIQYIKNDQLPTIALAHMCWADTAKDGVNDSKCVALAQLHSHAVDYPKNGEPAQMRRYLRPRLWPHFMERNHKSADQIYHSKKVLGQLYDIIERIDFIPVWDKPFDKRILDAFEVPPWMLFKASEIKTEYDLAIRRIMAQLGITTEFEVFSAFVMNFNREKKDFTLAEELGAITQAHKNRFREICSNCVNGRSYNELGPFLVAMYKTTEQEVQTALETRKHRIPTGESAEAGNIEDMPLISFPWIFSKELGTIANGNFRGEDKITVHLTSYLHKVKPKQKTLSLLDHSGASSIHMDISTIFDIPVFEGHKATPGKTFAPAHFNTAAKFEPSEYHYAEKTLRNDHSTEGATFESGRIEATLEHGHEEQKRSLSNLAPKKDSTAAFNPALSAICSKAEIDTPDSRPDTPLSEPRSESTGRVSTPPSSLGGHEMETETEAQTGTYDHEQEFERSNGGEGLVMRLITMMEDT